MKLSISLSSRAVLLKRLTKFLQNAGYNVTFFDKFVLASA